MSSLSNALLVQVIDDHIEWIVAWARSAFYDRQGSGARSNMIEPESFVRWRSEAVKMGQDQPALERLVASFDQLHRLARLAFLKTPEGMPVEARDFDAVMAKYQDFIFGMRRLERSQNVGQTQSMDVLTGFRPREGMRDDITRELSRFLRTRKPFCLALMDIDYFKKVNETYGHDNGNKVLSSVCNYITRSVRPFDEVWRWGGQVLLICLKEVDRKTGQVVLERVREGLEKLPIKLVTGREINVTASFGFVVVDDLSTVDSLLTSAERALCAAKKGGRNRIEFTRDQKQA